MHVKKDCFNFFRMLVCGKVNPPAKNAEYNGVYFGGKDNMKEKAETLKGLPLQVEHNSNCQVGKVISGWIGGDGSMYALAEINTKQLPGAMTAAAIDRGNFREFSLGYKATMQRDSSSGKLLVTDKNIMEVSIVKKGALDGCCIMKYERIKP
jgi:phage head maturation protease